MQPTFKTERLVLRPFAYADAEKVQEYAGDLEVAKTTLTIPHPYPDGAAEAWIKACHERAERGDRFPFAVTVEGDLVGCISLIMSKPHQSGEIGYWIGKPFWGQGYATEAAKRVLQFGFEELALNKLWAAAMVKNPASSAIMKKIGMSYEGTFKQHVLKGEQFEDVVFYGLLRSDYYNKS